MGIIYWIINFNDRVELVFYLIDEIFDDWDGGSGD